MTVKEAEHQLDHFEKTTGILILNRTRHMILRAVAAGTSSVGFHGLDADLTTNAGIRIAAGLLNAHPTAWMEIVPEVCAPPATAEPSVGRDPKPRFGL